MIDNARVPVRPLSYSSMGASLANFKGEFNSIDSLPTTNVESNDYAIVNNNLYRYENGAWNQHDNAIPYTIPNAKELIVDYTNHIIYICDENRNVVKAIGAGSNAHITATISSDTDLWVNDSEKNAYMQTIDITDIKETDYPIIDIVLSDEYNTALEELNEYKKIYKIITFDGYIEVYSNSPVSIDLNIILKK